MHPRLAHQRDLTPLLPRDRISGPGATATVDFRQARHGYQLRYHLALCSDYPQRSRYQVSVWAEGSRSWNEVYAFAPHTYTITADPDALDDVLDPATNAVADPRASTAVKACSWQKIIDALTEQADAVLTPDPAPAPRRDVLYTGAVAEYLFPDRDTAVLDAEIDAVEAQVTAAGHQVDWSDAGCGIVCVGIGDRFWSVGGDFTQMAADAAAIAPRLRGVRLQQICNLSTDTGTVIDLPDPACAGYLTTTTAPTALATDTQSPPSPTGDTGADTTAANSGPQL